MPLYEFQHPETGEIIEVVQKMKDPHVYETDGVEWKRVWKSPNASIDTEMDPYSESYFMRCTAKKGMTYGDMADLSTQLSQKRERNQDGDHIKRKAVNKYEKKTGKAHPNKKTNKPSSSNIVEI